MSPRLVRIASLAVLALTAHGAAAQNKCTAKGRMGGEPFDLAHCEVAYYAGDQSVTIWFSSTPIAAEEREFFQMSSSADRFRKGRTMVQVAFCPGGGQAAASAAAVKSVEIAFAHATVASLGPQDQWVLKPAATKDIRIDRLAGNLSKGGTLNGRITGAIAGRNPPFSWDLAFDLALPQRAAGGGPGCS